MRALVHDGCQAVTMGGARVARRPDHDAAESMKRILEPSGPPVTGVAEADATPYAGAPQPLDHPLERT